MRSGHTFLISGQHPNLLRGSDEARFIASAFSGLALVARRHGGLYKRWRPIFPFGQQNSGH
jgi:hypothetical protein